MTWELIESTIQMRMDNLKNIIIIVFIVIDEQMFIQLLIVEAFYVELLVYLNNISIKSYQLNQI